MRYMPSKIEVDRGALSPHCVITRVVKMVCGEIIYTQDSGPCKECGATHTILDEYENGEQLNKSLANPVTTGYWVSDGKGGIEGYTPFSDTPTPTAKSLFPPLRKKALPAPIGPLFGRSQVGQIRHKMIG